MNHITSEVCKQLIQSNEAELIDIREPWEVEICSIGGTKIPMHQVPELAETMDKMKPYIILCKTGRRAESVANLLECRYGFQHIAILEGGITGWFEAFEPNYKMY
ncbi:rhodanese-like domain-containing protein [Fluviicola sp.]|jgi:adenylyltransferase/sulfurtransferase|uniref:rhodanese-like domain-containing protein n=1 Tax=Fluviicola sp. TaxID=1917219 RepID=UPI0028273031|nr:rhodanese-like domain-containing protein [Fluviicola sp.]MDR0802503.1 rhodanese-like domain-containing protein [Fluviicola sp.]